MRSGTIRGRVAGLLALLLPTLPGALAGQSSPGSGDGLSPGRLVGAELAAWIEDGGRARVEVTMELEGLGGWSSLPLEALAFGGVPRDLTAGLNGGPPVPVALTESRPAFWEGRVPLGSGTADRVHLSLAYRVDGALRVGSAPGSDEAELAFPWVVVPWAPVDGAPDRVALRIGFPVPVVLEGSFPSGLRGHAEAGAGRAAVEWAAGLPVLPAMVRSRVAGAPATSVHAGTTVGGGAERPGAPPAMPPPGFVFTGLFLAFGGVALAYVGWMLRAEARV